MKATGIVRRIDDLGRVVIPKEIRRTMHIREGDPLEIYTDKDGGVIFKKYSPMGELSDFATQICDTMSKTTGCTAAVADRDTIIAISGGPRRELLEKRISGELEQIMEARQFYRYKEGEHRIPIIDGTDKYGIATAAPIIAEGDILGCVLFVEGEGGAQVGDTEFKLAQTIAGFLGKQMES